MRTSISLVYLRMFVRSAQAIFESTNLLNRIQFKKRSLHSYLTIEASINSWNIKNNIFKGFKLMQKKCDDHHPSHISTYSQITMTWFKSREQYKSFGLQKTAVEDIDQSMALIEFAHE